MGLICCQVVSGIQSNLAKEIKQIKCELGSKLEGFDKKRYDEFVKKILRTKGPSFTSSLVTKSFKEMLYLVASGAAGVGAAYESSDKNDESAGAAYGCIVAVVTHTIMRLFFDYLLATKNENLVNLENFEQYINKVFSSDQALLSKESDLVLRLFEKDYDLILNKIDQDRGAGIIKRMIKWMFRESTYGIESALMGIGVMSLVAYKAYDSKSLKVDGFFGKKTLSCAGGGFLACIAYFVFLNLLFDVALASEDYRLAKIEKLREINQFIDAAKLQKIALQQEVAKTV